MAEEDVPSQRIILFYKYHPLSSDLSVVEEYRASLERLCRSLHLTGRILVGASETEGINGTLAGTEISIRTFTYALLKERGSLFGLQSSELMKATVFASISDVKRTLVTLAPKVLLSYGI